MPHYLIFGFGCIIGAAGAIMLLGILSCASYGSRQVERREYEEETGRCYYCGATKTK